MNIQIRQGTPADAGACGEICHAAFRQIAEAHGFPPDFPSAEAAGGLLSALLATPGFYSVVAERDGRIVGSNFADERGPVVGVGPITVDPAGQNSSVGRALMEAVLERAERRGFPGVRLLQAAYHNRSLALYSKLGFVVREPVSAIQGPALNLRVKGCEVRLAVEADRPECNRICHHIHGHDRGGELGDAIGQNAASVVVRDGRITGYTTAIAYFGHSVGETNDDLRALIGAASEFQGPGFLLPSRNADLLHWCLAHGLRVVQPMTLMSKGLYNEPAGAFLPSILY